MLEPSKSINRIQIDPSKSLIQNLQAHSDANGRRFELLISHYNNEAKMSDSTSKAFNAPLNQLSVKERIRTLKANHPGGSDPASKNLTIDGLKTDHNYNDNVATRIAELQLAAQTEFFDAHKNDFVKDYGASATAAAAPAASAASAASPPAAKK